MVNRLHKLFLARGLQIGGAAPVATYAEVLRDTYGASEIWPLVDIASGTTISAFINSNRNGTLTGWDLQNAAGPVTGTLAPYSDGVNDRGNIYTSNGSDGLNDIFSLQEGSVFAWAKATSWTDGASRRAVYLRCSATNFVSLEKSSTNGNFNFSYVANDVNKTVTKTSISESGLFSIGMSYSQTNDEVKAFWNGAQQGSTLTSLGAPTDETLVAANTAIGAFNTTSGSGSWDGLLAYVAVIFGSIWSPTDFQNMHDAAATAGAD